MTDTTERELAARLAAIRLALGWRCRCGCAEFDQLRVRPRVFQCCDCDRQLSVTAGTILHRTRLPLGHWFRAIELFVTRGGVSAHELARELDIHVETAWNLLHRIRACLEGGDEVLRGACEQYLDVLECRPPCVEHYVEAAFLTDATDRAVTVVGHPRVDRAIGLEGWERIEDRYQGRNRGSPTRCPPPECPPDPEVRGAFLAPDAVVDATWDLRTPKEFARVLTWRLERTYHQVSGRWLQRYATAAAVLWRSWRDGKMPNWIESKASTVALVWARCLGTPKARFSQLVPPWPPPYGV